MAAFAAPTPAQADVRIYLGVPFHPNRVGPGWRYYDGYGWYDYGRYGHFRPNKLTCSQARRRVDRNGYNNVDPGIARAAPTASGPRPARASASPSYVDAYTGDMWR
jgi:hypothetical protein